MDRRVLEVAEYRDKPEQSARACGWTQESQTTEGRDEIAEAVARCWRVKERKGDVAES